MTQIDWSKAPEGYDVHINFDGREAFYRDDGHRYVRPNDHYVFKTDAERLDAIITLRPASWTGEGLPPVGSDVEYNIGDGWYECLVKYVLNRSGEHSYALVAWCYHLDKDQYLSQDKGCKFRQIRTPEQIASEKIQAIRDEIGYQRPQLGICPVEAMYNLGYRKMMADAEEVKA